MDATVCVSPVRDHRVDVTYSTQLHSMHGYSAMHLGCAHVVAPCYSCLAAHQIWRTAAAAYCSLCTITHTLAHTWLMILVHCMLLLLLLLLPGVAVH
jgi:hypothetical protein